MNPERAIYAQSLGLVKEIHEQVRSGKLSDEVLALYQRAFIATLGNPLTLSPRDEVLLTRLSIASPAEPVSQAPLEHYVLVNTENNGEDNEQSVVTDMFRLNTDLRRATGLRINKVPAQADQQEGWYLGSFPISLSTRESQIISLVAAGFFAKEIADRQGYSTSTIKNKLSDLYVRLGVSSGRGAALLLLEEGLLDTREIEARVNIDSFKSLSRRQKDILECLLVNGDATNHELAMRLSCSESTIKNYLTYIGTKVLREDGYANRVVLTLGYAIYKARNQDEDQVEQGSVQTLTTRQTDVLKLMAMNLSNKSIAAKLSLSESTIKGILSAAYRVLGVKDSTAAVIKLISDGLVDPSELVTGEDLSLFDRLTPLEKALVENLASGLNLPDRENKTLAGELGYSESTIKNRLSVIGDILGISGWRVKTRIAVLYMAYKRQQG